MAFDQISTWCRHLSTPATHMSAQAKTQPTHNPHNTRCQWIHSPQLFTLPQVSSRSRYRSSISNWPYLVLAVIKTFIEHSNRKRKKLQRGQLEELSTDDILYDEYADTSYRWIIIVAYNAIIDRAFHIVKSFILLGTKNTVESLQSLWVPNHAQISYFSRLFLAQTLTYLHLTGRQFLQFKSLWSRRIVQLIPS